MRSLLLCLPLALSGCALLKLERELQRLPDFVMLSGEVLKSPAQAPVIVSAILRGPDGAPRVVEQQLQLRSQPYVFVLENGDYELTAFSDLNFNDAWDAGEPAALQRWRAPVSGAQPLPDSAEDLDLALSPKTALTPELVAALRAHKRPAKSVPESGGVVSLDDRRFQPGNGEIGLWRPLSFLRKLRGGLFLLEPYDAGKIPVLFVHGSSGTPQNFRVLLEGLDRTRYQPWFYYYASGLSLEYSAQRLDHMLSELQEQMNFSRLYMVAHSMGGLVARRAAALQARHPRDPVRLLLTLAAPWDGIASAKFGVEHLPTSIPCWRDLAPGSAFLQRLRAPLPDRVAQHLFFGFHNGSGLRLENTDGVASLASQLAPWAQAQATQLHGLNEDHTGMINSEAARVEFKRVMDLLAVHPP